MQRCLPRPSVIDADTLLENAANIVDPVEGAVAKETALLVINDALKYPDPDVPTKVTGASRPLEIFDDDELDKARLEIALEIPSSGGEERQQLFEKSWLEIHGASLLGLQDDGESESESEKEQVVAETINVSLFCRTFPSAAKKLTSSFLTLVSPRHPFINSHCRQRPREEACLTSRRVSFARQDFTGENRRGRGRSRGRVDHVGHLPHAADRRGGGVTQAAGTSGRGGHVCEGKGARGAGGLSIEKGGAGKL